ncbi:MAG TPA: hypothetical protein VN829_23695 [Dongiaceae bacterium]|nr:hypothetical protein [Dongiaceae bacterium]
MTQPLCLLLFGGELLLELLIDHQYRHENAEAGEDYEDKRNYHRIALG